MNISAGYIRHPPVINDLHFRVRGPVVGHFLHSFASDWQFACGELVDNSYAGPARVGDMLCRGISTGPDADIGKRRLTLLAAISRADSNIRLVTPYFVPDQTLQTALQLAVLRGVRVEIVLPARNNLPLVHWASLHVLDWLAREGCQVYLVAPPFDHSKLMTVDGLWSLVGSGNWDARSLRLNFEYDMECYSRVLAERLNHLIDARLSHATELTHDMLAHQALPVRLRNALSHLLAPYL
jgi:cardiolipin synthase